MLQDSGAVDAPVEIRVVAAQAGELVVYATTVDVGATGSSVKIASVG